MRTRYLLPTMAVSGDLLTVIYPAFGQNWTDVATAATVTNLQNQVILVPAPTGNSFYRLKQP